VDVYRSKSYNPSVLSSVKTNPIGVQGIYKQPPQESEYNESDYSATSKLSLLDKMLQGDYNRRKAYLNERSRSTAPSNEPMVAFPYSPGMCLGSQRKRGIKVLTSLGPSPEDLRQ